MRALLACKASALTWSLSKGRFSLLKLFIIVVIISVRVCTRVCVRAHVCVQGFLSVCGVCACDYVVRLSG